MSKSMALFERLVKLLHKTGYVQQEINGGYKNGPAGTLLRNNLQKTWLDRMVTQSDSCFPVTQHEQKDLLLFYPEIFEMINRTVPFSIANVASQPKHSVSQDGYLSKIIDQRHETSLRFLHICPPMLVGQTFDQVVNTRISWWKKYSETSSHFTQKDATDDNMLPQLHIQYAFPWGQENIETIYNSGDEKLVKLEEMTGSHCQYKCGKKSLYPHCIECCTTVETAMAVFLTDAYTEKPTIDDTNITRQVLQLSPSLAPFKVAITPDGTQQRQIQAVATYISRELRKAGIQLLDTRDTDTSLHDRVTRYDEMGVPFTVVVNDATIETGAISLRSRDTCIYETLAINKICDHIQRHIAGTN